MLKVCLNNYSMNDAMDMLKRFSMKKERFEQRLFRIFAQAGYSPVQLLTVTPEEMVEIPGITVPNIRELLCVQNRVLAEQNTLRAGRLVEELLQKAEESRRDNE